MLRLVLGDEVPGPPALPGPRECVVCFVERMVVAYGCSNRLHWTALWRDRRAPRATALERRLQGSGGYCDCEVLANAYARREEWEGDEPPDCREVSRRGSTQPCDHWVEQTGW